MSEFKAASSDSIRPTRGGLWLWMLPWCAIMFLAPYLPATMQIGLGIAAVTAIVGTAIVTYARTRWLLRAGNLVVSAALLASLQWVIWTVPGDLERLFWIILLFWVLILHMFAARALERRLDPEKFRAFEEAARAAGPWGFLRLRQIPRLAR